MNGLYLTQLSGQQLYASLVKPLGGKPLKMSKKVFDNSKVTDHHAIIPTGIPPQGLTEMEEKVFDLVARNFIAAFYEDCKFETTTVMGEVRRTTEPASPQASPVSVLFRATGKRITHEGWKVVFKRVAQSQEPAEGEAGGETPERLFPEFVKGESGPHVPSLNEKWTTPPKPYTEATLLRAMETAGRLVDNEELRDALKENGIGRPSTRAAIIETLFRRRYIRKERTSLWATPTGVQLIHLIHEELLKSAELTGIWEKKLRQIEHHQYEARQFIEELKEMVSQIVLTVLADNSNRHVEYTAEEEKKGKKKK